ncbi:unnamed protein product, partial [Brassica rapa subsp. narinosa]
LNSPLSPKCLPYAPLKCRTCVSVLNAFARVDFAAKIWICPFCFQRNPFPPHYHMISETNLPGELCPLYTTVEYALPSTAGQDASSCVRVCSRYVYDRGGVGVR